MNFGTFFTLMLAVLACFYTGVPKGLEASEREPVLVVGYVGNIAINWPVYVARSQHFESELPRVNFRRFENRDDALMALRRGLIHGIVPLHLELAIREVRSNPSVWISGVVMKTPPYSLVLRRSGLEKGGKLRSKMGMTPWAASQEQLMFSHFLRRSEPEERAARTILEDVDKVDLVVTSGSFEKMVLISEKQIDFAFVLSELARYFRDERGLGDVEILPISDEPVPFPFLVGLTEKLDEKGRASPNPSAALHGLMSDVMQWLADGENRSAALDILVENTRIGRDLAEEIYDDYVVADVFSSNFGLSCDVFLDAVFPAEGLFGGEAEDAGYLDLSRCVEE